MGGWDDQVDPPKYGIRVVIMPLAIKHLLCARHTSENSLFLEVGMD